MARLPSVLVASAVGLCACGGGSGGDPPVLGPPVAPPPSNCPGATAVALTADRAFPALSFTSPVGLLQEPGTGSRWFVIEQAGVVRAFANDDAATATTVFADLRDRVTASGERGLLGIAFHPRFPADPRVFVSYTTGSLVSRISSFRSDDGGATLDVASEQVLLSVNQPEANHNGGHLAFGPDGLLYIGFGDGGGGGDAHGTIGNGQQLATLLGKILRIDVDATPPTGAKYSIPSTNPFPDGAVCDGGGSSVGGARCAEIYAYGFRNPWRFSFDRQGGALWVADVGEGAWEEIDRVSVGGNYGWRCREGAHAFNGNCGGATGLIDPVAEYSHSVGSSITGGFVYRGSAHPTLAGRYVFGDFGSGRLWSIDATAAPTQAVTGGSDTAVKFSAFGERRDGELFAVSYSGTLHKVAAAACR